MRQRLFHILFIALLSMAFPFHSSGNDKVIDFNFPQDVSKEALTDLNKALKSGDGQLTVDALVRYSIAQSGISQDNMPDIISRIESTINKEKQPHIRALLYHLEALVYQGYSDRYARWSDRQNPVGELPDDISEWDSDQFDLKIAQLIDKSLADPAALKAVPVTSLPDIILCNDLGAAYVPTLLEFLSKKGIEMIEGKDIYNYQVTRIREAWIAATEGNTPANIYAIGTSGTTVPHETYDRYRDNEHCAFLLDHMSWSSNKDKYRDLKDYVQRFPNSIYTPGVKNKIIDLESKSIHLSYPEVCSSHDSITVKADVTNANAFNINVYRVPDNLIDGYRIKRDQLKQVYSCPVQVQGNIPFDVNGITTVLPPLPYGVYAIVPDGDDLGRKTSEQDIFGYDLLRVTDMAIFTISRNDHKDRVAAVDINTGKPLSGVTILTLKDRIKLGMTGTDGTLAIDNRPNAKGFIRELSDKELFPVKGDDRYGRSVYYCDIEENGRDYNKAEVFTDLGVYRPGETVQWAAIVYSQGEKSRQVLASKTVDVTFEDTNREPIDTLTLTTDEWGRIEGSFVVPKDRMNGQFHIKVIEKRTQKGNHYYDYLALKMVNVSEYKTPTFEVTFPNARRNYVAGEPVKVTGKAMTYSGLPVQDTEVRISLIQNEWSWWWWRNNNDDGEHLQDTTVMTDGQGNFTIEFAPNLFDENKGYRPGKRCWAHYNYRVVATVTTDAGETHEENTSFILGTRRGIELLNVNDDIYLNDKPIKLPLKYNTTDEEHPDTWCTWEVTPLEAKEPVLTGNLNTADPTIDLTRLPSGQYTLRIQVLDAEEDEEDVDVVRDITIYRKTDKQAPVKDCPLWLTPLQQTVDSKNTGHITVGVSTPRAYIYYVASTIDGVIAQGWLNYDKGMHDFTVALPREAGKDVTVRFISHYGTKQWDETVQLENPFKAESIKITATSFRDKLAPGDIEHWTFTLTDQNGKPHCGAMMLDMFDKAIASIEANTWNHPMWRPGGQPFYIVTTSLRGTNYTYASWMEPTFDIPKDALAITPTLNTYATFFGRGYGRVDKRLASGGPMMMAKANDVSRDLEGHVAGIQLEAAMEESALYDSYQNDNAGAVNEVVVTELGIVEDDKVAPEVNEKNLDKVVLRESDVKTALWMPLLTSDDKGNVQVEFEAPNFNTTWISQAVAWDKKMTGSQWLAEVLTQKPLMVRSNMPRFLRQGDKATLAATVQNATDVATACDAVIELFDPRSGDIYTTDKFNLQLAPSGSQAVTIDWQVPDTVSMVGFRIKAANDRFGDGEQVMVPVLTTISPVIETEPFYIEAAQGHFETALPQFPKDARVTLEYCDNPTWYCVLALPTIFSDNYYVATHAAHSLFALQVAQGVAKAQPQIKEAVTYWKQHNEDSTLVSMLQKNQDLKIGTLLASPWMREADRQTLRMSKLNELFDEAIVNKEYEKIITALQSLQMGDGGFTWFRYPGCRSNAWTTGSVLELIGEIKHLGYLPDDNRLTTMINRALAYYDNETVRLFNEAKRYNKEPYGQFTAYAYTRSLFPEVKQQSKASADLFKKVVKFMDKNWSKGITLKQKAYYAMTLNRNGYQKTARQIVESIRQFAIVKQGLGMYWDNLQTGYGWWELDKVAYTSTVLQAMNEVDPRQQEIDQVRKWMLLMKQSNDWGSYSLAADAVYSILSTGSQWLDRAATPTITVAGQPVNLDKMAQWLGYFRTTLPATTTGSVVIDRTGNSPAWGAIYSQFKAPMTQIQEKAIDEVSISKEYYAYAQDGSLHQATSFKVGDKVKVRVIIKTNKDMDFVTMTDERAACFEPVDQLSGYRSEDNMWFYQETKDTQTNVFINSLDKGTHIIGYDVWVTNSGEFTSGIATIQCQYAPQLSAHSSGKKIIVEGN